MTPADLPDQPPDPAVRLLRETLAAHDLPDGVPPDLASGARRRAARAGRTRLAVLSAAAASALIVLGVGIGMGAGRPAGIAPQTGPPSSPQSSSESPMPSALVAPSPLPTGWKRISSLGLELAVPQDWPVTGAIAGCGPLPSAAVVRGGGWVAGCGYQEPATFTLVQLDRLAAVRRAAAAGPAPGESPSPQPLDRLPASLTESTLTDGRHQLVLAFEDRDAAVLLRGPDLHVLQQILATVQLTGPLDVYCPLDDRAGSVPWDVRGRADLPGIDIGDAVAVQVCAYEASSSDPVVRRLVASTELTGADATPLLAALRGSPKGLNPDAAPGGCLSPTSEQSSLRLVLIHRTSGLQAVAVHYSGCTDRYLATENGRSRVTTALLHAAYDPLGIGFMMMSPLT